MSDQFISSLESRRLFSVSFPELPPGIDPGDIQNFNGVKIDASLFPQSPVTVQVTSQGEIVALPILKDGVITATATNGPDSVTVQSRAGVDPDSILPGIIFFDGVESGTQGVQIFGSVAEAVASFDSITESLNTAVTSLESTRDLLASMGQDTTAIDEQISSIGQKFDDVLAALDLALTTSFVRVTVAGQYDAYFSADKVTSVNVDSLGGDDIITSTVTGAGRLTIAGGAGNDTISSAGSARLLGGAGNDRLVAGAASLLDGGIGDDVLVGSPDTDTLIGGGGKDTLDTSRNRRGVYDVVPRSTSIRSVGFKSFATKLLASNRTLLD